MTTQKSLDWKTKPGKKLQTVSLLVCLALPLLSCAAVKETDMAEPGTPVDTAIKPAASSEDNNNKQKNLANEPEPLGKLLYENHCLSCHESIVHIRGAHKAKTYEDVQYWVGRWALELDVKWSADEIDAVVQHLNDRFYHY